MTNFLHSRREKLKAYDTKNPADASSDAGVEVSYRNVYAIRYEENP
jgi:hypothetical protein